jgi:sec-independent protein translocase protein TatA
LGCSLGLTLSCHLLSHTSTDPFSKGSARGNFWEILGIPGGFSAMTLPVFAIGVPGPLELCIIAGIVLLLFGNRLPGAMRSMGRSITEFKSGMKEGEEELEAPRENEPQK